MVVVVSVWVIEAYACSQLTSAILPSTYLTHPRRAYLAGWVLEGGVGAGSVNTCSVRGPGRTVVASGSLGPGSGTSVASVASSVDWDGLTFPLAVAATSPVEKKSKPGKAEKEECGDREKTI